MTGTHIGPKTAAQMDTVFNTVLDSNLSATTKIIRSTTVVVAASDSSAKSKDQADYVCDGTNDEVEIQAGITAGAGGKIVLLEGNYSKGNVAGITVPSNTEVEIIKGAVLSYITDVGDGAVMFTNSEGASNFKIYGGGVLNGNIDNQSSGTQSAILLSGATNGTIDIRMIEFTGRPVSNDNSTNIIINEEYPFAGTIPHKLPRALINHPNVKLLSPMNSDAGWVGVNGATWDTTHIYAGQSSLKCTCAIGSTYTEFVSKTFDPVLDLTNCDFGVWVYIDTKIDVCLKTTFFAPNASNFFAPRQEYYKIIGPRVNDWIFVPFNILDQDNGWTTGSPDITNITKITLYAYSPGNSVPVTLWIGGVCIIPRPKKYRNGAIVLNFDDGVTNQYTVAFPILKKYGFKGCLFITPSGVGRSGYATLEELNTMYKLGWDICSHSWEHIDLQNLSPGEIEYQGAKAQSWLIQHGFDISALYFAYPYGNHSLLSRSILSDYYDLQRGVYAAHDLSTPPAINPDLILTSITMSVGSYTTLENLQAIVDHIVSAKSLGVFHFHRIESEPTPADFESMMAYIKSTGLPVVTWDDIYNDCYNYTSENSGTATITATTTSITVNHGLATTPTKININPKTNLLGKSFWTSDHGATTFVINISEADATNPIYFNWSAEV